MKAITRSETAIVAIEKIEPAIEVNDENLKSLKLIIDARNSPKQNSRYSLLSTF